MNSHVYDCCGRTPEGTVSRVTYEELQELEQNMQIAKNSCDSDADECALKLSAINQIYTNISGIETDIEAIEDNVESIEEHVDDIETSCSNYADECGEYADECSEYADDCDAYTQSCSASATVCQQVQASVGCMIDRESYDALTTYANSIYYVYDD